KCAQMKLALVKRLGEVHRLQVHDNFAVEARLVLHQVLERLPGESQEKRRHVAKCAWRQTDAVDDLVTGLAGDRAEDRRHEDGENGTTHVYARRRATWSNPDTAVEWIESISNNKDSQEQPPRGFRCSHFNRSSAP